jgi:hypothetical protein
MKQTSMKNPFIAVFSAIWIVSAVLTGCFQKNTPPDLIDNEINLFMKNDVSITSIQSGNLLFGNFLTSDGTYIYYHSKDRSKLIRSDYDGQNKVVLSSKTPLFISVVDDTVFFLDDKMNGSIFKVSINGDGESLVLQTHAKSLVTTHQYIFYIGAEDGYVYRILHDGSERAVILERDTTQLTFYENRLYMQVLADSENQLPGGIYSSTIQNIELAVASGDKIDVHLDFFQTNSDIVYLNVFNDELYFFESEKERILSLISENRKKILTEVAMARPFIISDHKLFYINKEDQNRLYRIDFYVNTKGYPIINDKVHDFVVCGNTIYYKRENSAVIYMVPIVGGVSAKVS